MPTWNATHTTSRFITLFVGILDPHTRVLTWASGGHNPPYILRASDRSVHELDSTGPALGIFEDAAFKQGPPVTLEPGDVFLGFTDGIVEAKSADGTFFGEERLQATLLEQLGIGAHAEDMLARVLKTYDEFVGDVPAADDVTLLLVRAAAL